MPNTFNSISLGYALDAAAWTSPYLALLYQDPARTAESFTVDGSGYITMTATTPQIKTALGKRVNVTTSATLPSQSIFFMIPHASDPDKFKIALTAADAIANAPITVSGSATGTVYDVDIDANDEMTSLVSYELGFAGYARQFSSLGTTTFTSPPAVPKATKVGATATFTSTDTVTFECTHILAIFGGSSTPGSTGYNFYGVTENTGLTTVPIGNYTVTLTMEATNG